MGDSIEALIPKTQELLQPLIAKPKLADKLLTKPPFRFLHDIFAAVTQATGFATGLYNDFELDSANLKEKQQKITYLDKMVVCVSQCVGSDVDVRSAKIVAGLEPENTNVLLQALAQAASNKALDWTGAVQRTLAKVPSLTPDGGSALPAALASVPAEAKASAAAERPASKERPSASEADKAAAAAEAKAKDKVRKEKDDDTARRDKEQKAEAAAAQAQTKPKAAAVAAADAPEPKSGSNSRTSSSSSARTSSTKATADNNNKEASDALTQQIRECTGDVERTKDAIEKIIQKPKMAAKLLSKPPFRFLHDIVSEITRVTGFADGLYSADELDSASIKEKQPKIDYLTKILQCVSCQLNVEVDAKPAKIVAGLEPDDTNKFLQLLALACRAGSSADAVQRVLTGDTAVRATSAAKKPASKAAEREATPEAKGSSRSVTPIEAKSRPASKESSKDASGNAGAGAFGAPVKPLALKTSDKDDENKATSRVNAGAKDTTNDDDDEQQQPTAPGTSGGLGTSRTSRPTTARRRPPKLKENVTEVGRLQVHDTKVAPVVGIMKDGDNNRDSDDDDADRETDNNAIGGSNSRTSQRHDNNDSSGGSGAHGKLVRDILKDQSADEAAARKLRDGDGDDGGETTATETESGIRLGRRSKSFKDKKTKSSGGASNVSEMNELRSRIQRICQATNPVGKGVEFVHEDLAAMSTELAMWTREFESKRLLLDDEKKKTDDALQPLQLQLLEVDEQIKEQVHKINALKATIAKNEDKTQKLLHMVVSA